MDPSAFDRLSRMLAAAPNRRGAITGLIGTLAALLNRGAPSEAGAQARTCRPLNRPCFPARGLDCCHGVCRNGRCRCPRRQRACRGKCIPKRHCCGSGQCGGGQVCRHGRCQCPPGKRRCGERCLAPGACCRDGECGAGERCVQGRCRCAVGSKPCQGGCIPAGQCCRDGECGPGSACVGGRCQCAAGFKPCNDGCIPQAACCGGCDPEQACDNGTCVPRRCGLEGPCRVFFTSLPYNGDLREGGQGSGIDGADAKCQARALAAGLTGTYKAWLSGSTLASSPSQRFTNTANTGPYVLPDANATVIAADWTELTSGTLRNQINVTETGAPAGNTAAWTHTLANGTPGGISNVHCQEWTSAAASVGGDYGTRDSTNAEWTVFNTVRCDDALGSNLYCFEQG